MRQSLIEGAQFASPSELGNRQPRVSSNDNLDQRQKRAASIGELVGGVRLKTTRSFQPVRRESYYANDERAVSVWKPIASGNKKDAWRIIRARMRAAEAYDRSLKEAGKKNGPLGHVGLEVLAELHRLVDFKTGRLDPAISTICDRIKRSRPAVVAALARLKAHGFLDWIRPAEPTGTEGSGPQVKQITNAYWLTLPDCAAQWLRRSIGEAPEPDCEATRRASQRAELDEMLGQLPLGDQASMLTDDPDLERLLRSLGNSISGQ